MTSAELFKTLKPSRTKEFEGYRMRTGGLSLNYSDVFSHLIKDAARTNRFQSDVYYSLKDIENAINNFDPDNMPDPIWVAFRKDGVDGTSYILVTYDDQNTYGSLSKRYFTLYSISFRSEDSHFGERYFMDFNEYWV